MSRKEYIGESIAKARKKKRLSQKAVSELTGIDKTSISKIERGRLNATIDTIDKLCNAVGARIRIFEDNYMFEDLVFEKHPFHVLADQLGDAYPNYESSKTCYQAKKQLRNGLSISVVIGTPFYSNGVDTYEVCLWSESGYQEVFGNLSDMEVSHLMEYSQKITDINILAYLQANGFELLQMHSGSFGYTKKHKEWYVFVNPCGNPIIGASKEPRNFGRIQDYRSFEHIKERLDNLDEYVDYLESKE